jgi:hypothetical protein
VARLVESMLGRHLLRANRVVATEVVPCRCTAVFRDGYVLSCRMGRALSLHGTWATRAIGIPLTL